VVVVGVVVVGVGVGVGGLVGVVGASEIEELFGRKELIEPWPQVALRAFGGHVAASREQTTDRLGEHELVAERSHRRGIRRLGKNPAGARASGGSGRGHR
jgi:hypothetical protein